ncbi:MAG TPA: bifunctional phosphopantothenoylcysteine decarboxylase/phosphopantothenate--cysteine ligase CoaBC [Tepidisphaeraceae bacterium]|jgi:phosphopantothenoylcysteine decarboxylase/phosphopantothenate--cysteine ligase|nr:bifunctional phosphopantothenoylcysteine decarboxylase/phosphopantothenate--cysteine ligase CoaBC [Tepidisphaeraceae bacterium]
MSATPDANAPQPLAGKEIVVGVCGGIAAYKVADVVSKLVQAGAGVTVAMTDDAQKFIAPLTFEALSGRPVRTSTFNLVESSDPQHISLTERADLMLIAPATANTIAKIAHGLCDDLLTLLVSAAACPVVFAPAMNNRMWENPITKENVAKLEKLSYRFIGPESGWLACRNVGIGRMSDSEKIMQEVSAMLIAQSPRGSSPSPSPKRAGSAQSKTKMQE